MYGNSVPAWPAAMSARPESGPNENMNVCVPSASVMNPSPPEICWHLMAPFAVFPLGATYPPREAFVTATGVNCVGPLYAGSVLLHPGFVGFVVQLVPVNGWVIVLVG